MEYYIKTAHDMTTEYTLAGFRLEPEQDEELQTEGYHSPFTLFVVFNDGLVYAHHDRHELVKNVNRNDVFLLDEFDAIQAELVG